MVEKKPTLVLWMIVICIFQITALCYLILCHIRIYTIGLSIFSKLLGIFFIWKTSLYYIKYVLKYYSILLLLIDVAKNKKL